MYKEEELNEIFNRAVVDYRKESNYIEFILDLKQLGIENNKYFNHTSFQLVDTGLLEILLTANSGIIEYQKKIKNLEDLKYAVLHLEEWEDDWNQD